MLHTPKQIEAIVVKITVAAAADDNPGKRAGFQKAVSIFNCLRRRWSFSERFLTRQHNMFYNLLDTTSLWILATWLSKGSPNKMRGPRLLSHLYPVTIRPHFVHRSSVSNPMSIPQWRRTNNKGHIVADATTYEVVSNMEIMPGRKMTRNSSSQSQPTLG